jgi:SAM-dependent methyltransferase
MHFGRLYRQRVMAPLAEQLVVAAEVKATEACTEVLCDGDSVLREPLVRLGAQATPQGGDFDVVFNLLTLGWSDPASTLATMRKMLKPGGRLALLTYSGGNAVHELILRDAVGEDGNLFPDLTGMLAQGTLVRELLRFDGPHQFWDTMVDGRDITQRYAPEQLKEIRHSIEESLRPYEAADGTILMPIDVMLYLERS